MTLGRNYQLTKRVKLQRLIYLVILSLLSSWSLPTNSHSDSTLSHSDSTPSFVLPVINAQNEQRAISRNGLSAIFKMRLTEWSDGTPITVFVLVDEHDLHKQFSKQILNVFPHQLRRIWNNAVFSGSGQAPITLNSIGEMKDMIASTPGAIGYLAIDSLDDQIKVLHIR